MDSTVSCPNYDTRDASTYNRITAVHRGAPANPQNRTPKFRRLAQPTHKYLRQAALQPDSSQRAAARKNVRHTIQARDQEERNTASLPARKAQHITRQRACRFGHRNDTRAYYTQPQPIDTREPIERPRRSIRFNAETKMKANRLKAADGAGIRGGVGARRNQVWSPACPWANSASPGSSQNTLAQPSGQSGGSRNSAGDNSE